MTTFIKEVLLDLKKKQVDFSQLTFILPSIRAGVFLKQELASILENTIFSPEVISIEEFTQELSGLKPLSNVELLFEFYDVYSQLTESSIRDSFEGFSKWGQILLQDFNEVDRYLIPEEDIFNYISAIQDLKVWYKDEYATDFIKQYKAFWGKLLEYYQTLRESLLNSGYAYQGLVYRQAVSNLEDYIQSSKRAHVFIGFNALNQAEESIFQELLQNEMASVYWDIDKVFFDNKLNDTGLFCRKYRFDWPYFKKHPFNWVSNYYSEKKEINLYGAPKSISQAKQIGNILKEGNLDITKTAVVLADEKLLLPTLNALPKDIQTLNITMGLKLESVPMASMFEKLFYLHKQGRSTMYFKDVESILAHQHIWPLFQTGNENWAQKIIQDIKLNNLSFLTIEKLKELAPNHHNIIDVLFSDWKHRSEIALERIDQLVFLIKKHLEVQKEDQKLALEYLYKFHALFNDLKHLQHRFEHLQTIKTLHEVYKNLLGSETVDFVGEPLSGLQIMGMLETRVLDFENVIIASVNEGILPAGKSQNSFIPYDVKLTYGLPTYKEKDAIYTYHFFRLIQRAKKVHIIYNTEVDHFGGGEKSRLLRQMELEGIHEINEQVVLPHVPPIQKELKSIPKDQTILQILQSYASNNGFSPSSLTSYIRDPFTFYKQRVLKVKEYEEVEETVAANTLGTVVHNTLEDFYRPFVGTFLEVEKLKALKPKIASMVKKHFDGIYKMGDITKGRNLIVFEIAKRYVSNFLDKEIQELQNGNTIKLLAVEEDNKIAIQIPELDFPVFISGKVDRIDEFNGMTRIIDYKSGKVDPGQVEIVNWEDLVTDYDKYSKSFQVLTYALMIYEKQLRTLPFEGGIISFKNLSKGFMKFGIKDNPRSRSKNQLITQEVLKSFEVELKKLIIEIFDLKTPFVEK
ncbi:PD-(D/E)XK nuclease family protein [Mangrovimonas futianensis]|uniref:PD-(D/E)XK nuclease family protein n=1 Tax=Mangrovimonas futianensis TaxID=2895523 RepID=UPI001E33F7E0|nr:PD-(D/E)XK nuclease family protein [Mangrovimonas futianensis]MCF1420783.1 PD-(D/E)XK nuclease family protein [Mangrovimonas futianensis]